MKTLIGCLLLLPLVCSAQTYKCQVNGKWEYQPYPCTNAPSQAVDTRPSTKGMTGLRTDANRIATQEKEAASFNPKQCTFQHFIYGDAIGKTLAEAARDECVATKGQQGPAYARWRDNYQTTSGQRDAAAARSQQQQMMNQPSPLNQPKAPNYNCTKNPFGGMDCTPRPY